MAQAPLLRGEKQKLHPCKWVSASPLEVHNARRLLSPLAPLLGGPRAVPHPPASSSLQLQRWAPAADVCRFRGEGSGGQGVGVAEGGAPLALIVSNLSVA